MAAPLSENLPARTRRRKGSCAVSCVTLNSPEKACTKATCGREDCGHDGQDGFAPRATPAWRVHQEQSAQLWDAAIAVRDHAVLRGGDRRHAAAAAQSHQ